MSSDPVRLIEHAVESLQSLILHLESDVAVTHARASALRAEERACKEALILIDMLIPKLQLARHARIVGANSQQQCLVYEE